MNSTWENVCLPPVYQFEAQVSVGGSPATAGILENVFSNIPFKGAYCDAIVTADECAPVETSCLLYDSATCM